jgi:hypothetical protein
MAFSGNVWDQLKNFTADDLKDAFEKDGWEKDPASMGKMLGFTKTGSPRKHVVIHYYPRKTYGPGLLKALLHDIGWNEADLRRLKLIKWG